MRGGQGNKLERERSKKKCERIAWGVGTSASAFPNGKTSGRVPAPTPWGAGKCLTNDSPRETSILFRGDCWSPRWVHCRGCLPACCGTCRGFGDAYCAHCGCSVQCAISFTTPLRVSVSWEPDRSFLKAQIHRSEIRPNFSRVWIYLPVPCIL